MTSRILCVTLLASLAYLGSVSGHSTCPVTEFSAQLETACSATSPGSRSVACSLWSVCKTNGTVMSQDLCSTTTLFSSLCEDIDNLSECTGTVGQEAAPCFHDWVVPLPNVVVVRQDLKAACASMPSMTGCQQCPDGDCPNAFGVLARMCQVMGGHDMNGCSHWDSFCDTLNSAAPGLCPAPPPAPPPPSSLEYCINSPRDGNCTRYTYADSKAEQDVDSLCSRMTDMPACYVRSLCKEGKIAGGYCDNFVLLGTMCLDMPDMSNCANYNAICSVGSVIKQCQSKPPIPRMPDTSNTRNSVLAACSDHSMPSCSSCRPGIGSCPNPLKSLVAVCNEHPSMSMCAPYHSLCAATGTSLGPLCVPSTGEFLPSMKMYFHQRVEEVILFRSWIPYHEGTYVASIIAIIFFGIVSQALKVWRAVMEARWAIELVQPVASPKVWAERANKLSVAAFGMTRSQLKRNTIRMLLSGVVLLLDYWNMLVVMTFNVGLLVAVIAGYMIGIFLFSHVQEQHLAAAAAAAGTPADPVPMVALQGCTVQQPNGKLTNVVNRMEMGMCTCNS